MSQTPDRTPGEALEEGILFEDQGASGLGGGLPGNVGQMRRVGGRVYTRDNVGLYEPRDISHFLVETSFDEAVYIGSQLSEVITWRTSSRLLRIRDVRCLYTGSRVTEVRTRQYADDGSTVLFTITETISYDGAGAVSNIDRVRS